MPAVANGDPVDIVLNRAGTGFHKDLHDYVRVPRFSGHASGSNWLRAGARQAGLNVRRRITVPTRPKPMISMSQLAGSGTAPTATASTAGRLA